MSNHGGGRAFFDRRVRYAPPLPQQPNIALPPRPQKPTFQKHNPFNPRQDVSSLLERLQSAPPPPVSQQKVDAVQLPVLRMKDQILQAVLSSQVTIIEAPTGSGKSTMVPKFLHDAGMKVTVLGPRRLPASELAIFGAQMRKEEVGNTIGFRHALQSSSSEHTSLIYSTEGYQLVRELHKPTPADGVIIFDEFHEHTANAETLLAIFKKRLLTGQPTPKIVIMSATLDSARVAEYFDAEHFGQVPVIKVEGRRFSVTQRERGESPAMDAVQFAQEGLNPLGFFYGKKEIEQQMEEITKIGTQAAVLPLHSQLPYEKQKLALLPHPQGKIVLATNTAQTSLTIADAGAVIVSGLVRRVTLDESGIPNLIIDEISQDEFMQQIGRVGRTSPGFYVSHAKPFNELKRHAPAEVQNVPLESIILRLAAGDEKFRNINQHLYHPVKKENVEHAYRVLHHLGLFGPDGHITDLGRRVANVPVTPRMGKLLVKALDYQRRYNVEIVPHAIDMAAIFESEGILADNSPNWRQRSQGKHSSDLLLETLVFRWASRQTQLEFEKCGINEVNFKRAREHQKILRHRLNPEMISTPPLHTEKPDRMNDEQKRWLSRAIIEAFADCAFSLVGRDESKNFLYKPLGGRKTATLSKDSVVGGSPLILGSRFNIGYLDEDGNHKTLPLIHHATRVDDLEWLEIHTPIQLRDEYRDGLSNLFKRKPKKKDRMVSRDFRDPYR